MVAATESVAAYAIVVDAKDACGKSFYESLGFIPLPSRPTRLFPPTETAAAALIAADAVLKNFRSHRITPRVRRGCGSARIEGGFTPPG